MAIKAEAERTGQFEEVTIGSNMNEVRTGTVGPVASRVVQHAHKLLAALNVLDTTQPKAMLYSRDCR